MRYRSPRSQRTKSNTPGSIRFQLRVSKDPADGHGRMRSATHDDRRTVATEVHPHFQEPGRCQERERGDSEGREYPRRQNRRLGVRRPTRRGSQESPSRDERHGCTDARHGNITGEQGIPDIISVIVPASAVPVSASRMTACPFLPRSDEREDHDRQLDRGPGSSQTIGRGFWRHVIHEGIKAA